MEPIKYCRKCAESILGNWKGWPHKDPIPLLPLIGDHGCAECGSVGEVVLNTEIYWLNYHGPYNTGLPDYWLLVTGKQTVWGRPYFQEVTCNRCKARAVMSEFGDTRRNHFKYRINCPGCGLLRPQLETPHEVTIGQRGSVLPP